MLEQHIADQLNRIEEFLGILLGRQQPKEWYTTEEVAKLLGKADFTVREWCRLGRVRAQKRQSGRGKFQAWVVSHGELLRFQKEGLLPQEAMQGSASPSPAKGSVVYEKQGIIS